MKAVFRIVNGLLAALIFPAALYLDLIYFQLSTNLAKAGLKDSISIKRIIDIFMGRDRLSSIVLGEAGNFIWPRELAPLSGKLIAAAVFFCLCLVAALFIIVWSCCSNKRLPVLAASICGIVFSIVMIACFNSAAVLITSGKVNLISALSHGGLLSSLLGSIVQIDKIILGGFQNAFIIIFGVIALWVGAFYLVELGDNKDGAKK